MARAWTTSTSEHRLSYDLIKAIENASIPLKQPQPPLADKPAG